MRSSLVRNQAHVELRCVASWAGCSVTQLADLLSSKFGKGAL
jgi:hypothetical protein